MKLLKIVTPFVIGMFLQDCMTILLRYLQMVGSA